MAEGILLVSKLSKNTSNDSTTTPHWIELFTNIIAHQDHYQWHKDLHQPGHLFIRTATLSDVEL